MSVAHAELRTIELDPARQFDFWLGEWDCTWQADGLEHSGTNSVYADLGGVVLVENFDGRPSLDFQGLSLSAYDRAEQRWKQLHEERPWAGGVIVAKAWSDPEFKQALLTTGREALRGMGVHQGKVGKLVVVENTDKIHNVIVCTLCSCYPYDILGDTPWWYKHESYRTAIVQNPRACVQEMFQLDIPADKEVRVWDSTSDVRYFVLPQRPAGTEGMSEEELAKLVTVDSLLGAGHALEPAQQREREAAHVEPEMPRVRPD